MISVPDRRGWYKDLFADILLYVCTVSNCPTPYRLYASQHEWMHHAPSAPPTQWSIVVDETPERETSNVKECPLCKQQGLPVPQLERHVARHLLEIACFVLPRPELAFNEFDIEKEPESGVIVDHSDLHDTDVSGGSEDSDWLDDSAKMSKKRPSARSDISPDLKSSLINDFVLSSTRMPSDYNTSIFREVPSVVLPTSPLVTENRRYPPHQEPPGLHLCNYCPSRIFTSKLVYDQIRLLGDFTCKGTIEGYIEWGCGMRFSKMDFFCSHFRHEAGQDCLASIREYEGYERSLSWLPRRSRIERINGLDIPIQVFTNYLKLYDYVANPRVYLHMDPPSAEVNPSSIGFATSKSSDN